MSNGSIRVQRGLCPPPITEGATPVAQPYPDPLEGQYDVHLSNIINALFDIEKWVKSVRGTLEKMKDERGDLTVTVHVPD